MPTPLEEKNFAALTSYQELVTYLATYAQWGNAHIETLGVSGQGRPIVMLRWGDSRSAEVRSTPLVLIYCQQHGNEPSGKEAALLFARELADTPEVLSHLEIILVPQVNPDGAEAGTRETADGVDMNRDHVALAARETQALHRLFLREMPEVTLDVHEYFPFSESWIMAGMIKDADVMMGEPTNPNIDGEIIAYAGTLVDEVGVAVRGRGYSFSRYVVGSPSEDARFRYSTTDLSDGRNSMGTYNTLSFIQEGKRYGSLADSLALRARSQATTMMALIHAVADHADTVMAVVQRARQRILGAEYRWAHLQYDYFPDSTRATVSLPIFDLYLWQRTTRALPRFEPLVLPKRSVIRPTAYLIDGGSTEIIEALHRHEVKMHRLSEPLSARVEEYLIVNVTPMEEEELQVSNVDVHPQPVRAPIPAGTVVVPLAQPAGLLIPLLLEPQSTRGLVSPAAAGEGHLGALLEPGTLFPVRRLLPEEASMP